MMSRTELNEEITNEIELEDKKEKIKKGFKIFLFIFIPLIVLTIVSLFLLTYVGNLNVIVKEYPIYDSKIPNDFHGIKITHFTDIHYGSIEMDKFRKTVNVINNTNADIVIFTGDLIKKGYKISDDEIEDMTNILSTINNKIGKYAILGDFDNDISSSILTNSGFEILGNNTNTKIYKDDSFINIITLNDIYSEYENVNLDNDSFTIALSHYPDNATSIVTKFAPSVIFAGHSLNGSIKLPLLGGIIKRDGAKKYVGSFYEIGNTKMYVSSGIGNIDNNYRLFNHPSINFYRLRKVNN